MLEYNLVGVISIYVLHSITLILLCPSRFKFSKSIAIWSGFIVSAVVAVLLLITEFPTYIGAALALSTTGMIFVVVALFLSAYTIPKTIFLFLTYLHVYISICSIAHLMSYLFFEDSQIVSIMIRSILHIGLIILCAIVVRNKFDEISHGIVKGWGPLNLVIVLLFINTSILLIRSYAVGYDWMEILPFLLLLIISAAVYWLFFTTIGYMQNITKTQQIELKSKFQMQQVYDMQESIEESKRIRHDAHHHNLQIVEYMRNQELDKLLIYLDQYEEESERHIPAKICENYAANNILNVYVRKAKQHNIDLSLDVSVNQTIGIKDVDMVAILANAMENALYGCIHSQKPQPFIQLFVGSKAGKLVIQVRNTIGSDANFGTGIPKSIYSEEIGVSSILHSASHYGGETDFQSNAEVCTCRILLKIPSK